MTHVTDKPLPRRRDFLAMAAAGCLMTPMMARRAGGDEGAEPERPNILWITTEDHSPYLGCYGDPLANTPHIDQLAREGLRYTNAFANAPVCAPTRFTLLTGTYAASMGTLHMRSRNPIPDAIRPYPELLREAGYYCTNNSKTDYNYATNDGSHWDESSNQAHYRNRAEGQPFFAIFNYTISHEGQIRDNNVAQRQENGMLPPEPRIAPEDFPLPPYHPDEPEIREDWVLFYDLMDLLDQQVHQRLQELEDNGLAEDTIVFFYSDHGGILARSKRFLYDTGTRVPLIVRVPEKWRHLAEAPPGESTDRVVSFVDFAPTLLSLAEVPIPSYMQGKAFLGPQTTAAPQYAFLYRGRMDERCDFSRAITDGRYRYVRHYMPQRIFGQHLNYPHEVQQNWTAWEAAYRAGRCNAVQSVFWEPKPVEELFDTELDPWEVINLAGESAFESLLKTMRTALKDKLLAVRDTGFIPESMFKYLAGDETIRDYALSNEYPMDLILRIADQATQRDIAQLPVIETALRDRHPVIRYWGAMGCALQPENIGAMKSTLMEMSREDLPANRIAAAEALAQMDEQDHALAMLREVVLDEDDAAATEAMNVLDYLEERTVFSPEELEQIAADNQRYNYAQRIAQYWLDNFVRA